MNDKIRERSDTLHRSILSAGEAVHPSFPTDFYLDPENKLIQWYTRTGAGIPAPAYHGIWVKIFQAPAGAIPESVVENLLKVEDYLAYDCEENFEGSEWDGRNWVGIWRNKPDYSMKFEFEIAVFWDPVDWFEPILCNLRQKWESGMNAAQIIDSEDLGNTVDGMVDRDEAIQWLEEKIQEWKEEAEEDPT